MFSPVLKNKLPKNILIVFLLIGILWSCEDRDKITGLRIKFEPGDEVAFNKFITPLFEGLVTEVSEEKASTVIYLKDEEDKLSRLLIYPSQNQLPEAAHIMVGDKIRFSQFAAINMTETNLEVYRNLKKFLQIVSDKQIPYVPLTDTRPNKLREGYRVEYLGLEIKEKREPVPPWLRSKVRLLYEPTGEEVVVSPNELKELNTKWSFVLVEANQTNPNFRSKISFADGPPDFWFSYVIFRDLKEFQE